MLVFNPNKIRQLMDERRNSDKKYRQTDFLKEIKLSLPGLTNILEGKSFPGVDTLMRIANYFGKDMNHFFNEPYKPNNSTNKLAISEPIDIYEPPTDKMEMYKVMFEQQKEIADQAKEIADLRVELERIKNANAAGLTAKIG